MIKLQLKEFAIVIAIISSFSCTAQALESQYNLRVDGITCPACIIKASDALKQIGGVGKVEFNLNEGIVKTCVQDGVVLDDKQVHELFLSKGFVYKGMEKQEQCSI